MGWLRTLFLGDIGNRLDIADLETTVDRIHADVSDRRRSNASLESQFNALTEEHAETKLALAATLMLLIEKGVVEPSEVVKMVEVVDASDGERDGSYSGPLT